MPGFRNPGVFFHHKGTKTQSPWSKADPKDLYCYLQCTSCMVGWHGKGFICQGKPLVSLMLGKIDGVDEGRPVVM
jgi:hypothetical protein